jgi:hypothetical protein
MLRRKIAAGGVRRARRTACGASPDLLHDCCFADCQSPPRRVGPPPYRYASTHASQPVNAVAPLDLAANYSVNPKALARWAHERLVLNRCDNGAIEARFRYDGTTCTNMGRPLAFEYTVRLAGRDQKYAIESGRCVPAAGDDGHRHMCRYLEDGDRLLATIAAELPLAGARIDDVLAWNRPVCAAGCYCDADSRQHKWGLVLETLHFALAQRERGNAAPLSEATRSEEGVLR